MKTNLRFVVLAGLVTATFAAFNSAGLAFQDETTPQETASEEAASSSDVSDVVKLQGVLNPIETLRLATRDPGIVTQVLVSEGSSVSAGDTIAVLDSEMYGAEVSAAQNELQIARQETKNDVDLQYAKMSSEVNQQVLSRSRRAAEQFAKSVSGTELERLRLEYERSRLSGLQAEREQDIHRLTESLKGDQLTIAQIRLKNRHVNSEIDGTVVEVFHTAGEYVNAGEPIARILNLNRLRVICAGSAREIRLSKLSDEAVFKFVQPDGEEISIPAKVTFLSPEIDPVRQTFAVWAEIQNDEALLRSGNIGTLEIKLKK